MSRAQGILLHGYPRDIGASGAPPVMVPTWPTVTSGTEIFRLEGKSLGDVDNAIEEWVDTSGNGRHFGQNSASLQPVVKLWNGNKAAYFDGDLLWSIPGNGGSWDLSDDVISNSFTVYLAAQKSVNATNRAYASFHGPNAVRGISIQSFDNIPTYSGNNARMGDGVTTISGVHTYSSTYRIVGSGNCDNTQGFVYAARWQTGEAVGNEWNCYDHLGRMRREGSLATLSSTAHDVDRGVIGRDGAGNSMTAPFFVLGYAAYVGKLNDEDDTAVVDHLRALVGI